MELRIKSTGQLITEHEFRAMHPRTSFPSSLNPSILLDFGADPVLEAPPPAVGLYQSPARNGVVQDALGNWVYAWVIRDWTADEITAAKDSARKAKIAAIETFRDKLVDEGGYKITVANQTYWIASDQRSKVRQLGLTMMGANVPAKAWRTLDGRTVMLNQAVVQSIFQAAAAQELAIDDAGEAHKAAVLASTDPATYDFSTGWPETFKP